MEAFVYTSLFCFMILASHGFPNGEDSDESNGSDYDYYGDNETTVPPPTTTTKVPCLSFLHLQSKTDMKPIGCTKHCPGKYDKMPEGTPCYDLTLEFSQSMAERKWYPCPLGTCEYGTCVKNGSDEMCRRVGTLKNE
uniref:Evasin n=1 Tax=Amblyomma cajennense TaxID=34607 RepID=A0A023FCU0_AMBCJ